MRGGFRKRRKKRRGGGWGGGPGPGGPMPSSYRGGDASLPSDEELEREAAELERSIKEGGSKAVKDALNG